MRDRNNIALDAKGCGYCDATTAVIKDGMAYSNLPEPVRARYTFTE